MSGWRPSGVVSVLPTAFHDDGSLDEAGTEALVRAHVAAGVDGITVLGVMGEAAELAEDERDRVVEVVVRAADGLPVVMGISGATPDAVVSRARRASRTGVTAVMVSPAASVSLRDAVESGGFAKSRRAEDRRALPSQRLSGGISWEFVDMRGLGFGF